MKRPLFLVTFLYVGGILLAEFTLVPFVPLLLAGFTLSLAAIAFPRVRSALLVPLIVVTGWSSARLHQEAFSPNDVRRLLGQQPHLLVARGRLCETPSIRVFEQGEKPGWSTIARLRLTAVRIDSEPWIPAYGMLAVNTPALLTNLYSAQEVEVSGVVAPPRRAAADGLFDYRAYLRQQGIYYALKAASSNDWNIISSPAHPPLADRFRLWARHALAAGLPAEDESVRLEWALTLGWKTALTEEASEPFVQAATYHIFAVDGLRMAIVFGIFFGLFHALRIPRAVCGMILLPLIWFYVALTGWPASAVRASVMLTLVIIGWLLRRPTDLLNSLFAAALIILVWQPQQLFQAGFQLSFFVVLVLILLITPIHHWAMRLFAPDPLLPESLRPHWYRALRRPGRYFLELTTSSFAAWLGSIPLVAYYFHIITPVSTPANILAVPLCALVLISNLSSLLLTGWLEPAAILFNHAGWFAMESIRVTSSWFADWRGAYYYVATPSLFTIFIYYGLLVALITGWFFRPAFRKIKWAAALLALGCWFTTEIRQHSREQLTVLTFNGGHALYLKQSFGRPDILLDCGSTNAVRQLTRPFLRAQGVNRLGHFVLTQGHVQQMGGALLIADEFDTRTTYASPLRFASRPYQRVLNALSSSPRKPRFVARGQSVGPLKVLHPDADDSFSLADDKALTALVDLSGTRLLLLPNLGSKGQQALLERYPDLRADIVVSGIPTRGEPVSDALLDQVSPRLLVICDSEFPAQARAKPQVLERLAKRKSMVVYTRQSGSVCLTFLNRAWVLSLSDGRDIDSRALSPEVYDGKLRVAPGSVAAPESAAEPDVPESEP